MSVRFYALSFRRYCPIFISTLILSALIATGPIRAEDSNVERPEAYGVHDGLIEGYAKRGIPIIDYHIHLRGGMTVEKVLRRQAMTGIRCSALKNIGRGWPIETEAQLREFIESVEGKPLFIGLQVNDRDWPSQIPAALRPHIDYILGDTMIMPDRSGKEVRLWMAEQVKIDDPQKWMDRYVAHNLVVLAEPIDILANPTYLPACLADRYDELWTEARMRRVISAAVKNGVALEINAKSGYPHDAFIRLAKEMGARFTIGSNNFNDRPIDMTRCFEAIDRHGLKREHMYVPDGRQ